jgi:outer membrane protein assembly factor BamA
LRKVVQDDLDGAVRPRPNSKLFFFPIKLSLYGLAGCDTAVGRGIKGAIRRLSEPPVLASTFDSVKNENLLKNVLENRGFFYPTVTSHTVTRRKKKRAVFDVWTGPLYTIRNVEFVKDSSRLSQDIASLQPETLLEQGAPFNLDLIIGERERIDKHLKEKGYYYFTPDYIIVRVDSSVGDNTVDMYVQAKNNIPEEAAKVFRINDVFIYPNYRLAVTDPLNNDTVVRQSFKDTLFHERYYIVGDTRRYKPQLFTQAMQFYPGDPFNRTDQNMAMNRLINMGTFKFVRNEFEPVGDSMLNTYYYLTPYPKKAIRLELGGYSKSDSRTGSQFTLSWRNRNLLRGAELLSIRGNAGTEVQGGGRFMNANTYQFGIEPSLTIPRFVIPFWDPKSSSIFVPRTVIKLGYDAIYRPPLYLLNSFRANYGYEWKENVHSEHMLYPFNANYVFVDTLNKDTTIFINYRNLLFDGLIIGPTYEYTYQTRVTGQPHLHDFYFNGLADLSGNILGLVQGASLNEPPKDIFGARYAQYMKFAIDFRHYMNYDVGPYAIWANRIILGFGYPYGNSYMLPNIKQFFSGGNSSLRGFRSRLVGPGTFRETPSTQSLIETSGDIKLELNTEVRRQLYSFIHGAVFADAGNVWTYRPNPIYNNLGAFSGKFLSELAVDVGVGLRLDFQILVLRLDLGIPVRKPWLTEQQRWDFKFDPSDPAWRGENMILNLAIGYPF